MKRSRVAASVLLLCCVLGAVIVVGRASHEAAAVRLKNDLRRSIPSDELNVSPVQQAGAKRAVIALLRSYQRGNFGGDMEFQNGMLDPREVFAGPELEDAVRVNYPLFISFKSVKFDHIYADALGAIILPATLIGDGRHTASVTFAVAPTQTRFVPYFVFDYEDTFSKSSRVSFAGRPLYADPRLMVLLQSAPKPQIAAIVRRPG